MVPNLLRVHVVAVPDFRQPFLDPVVGVVHADRQHPADRELGPARKDGILVGRADCPNVLIDLVIRE
jgi:hypothetical protein